ncbi:hypothetical protein [Roseibacillus ishigakijimensis]|uniref:Uncharacterized protein n=1 Tax=Roseibacillus ishigakijimensis TaxID=454146 RepID=A0A934RKP3_9BACT|nr:hypothetical protein [Roseibacillus ishigakijimensis]MBK1833482.1 hypothetical protein [Roseibacillus ishigakijimensis]
MKVSLLLLALTANLLGVTKEVVRVFHPVSYHETDSVSEFGVKGELLQAAVIDRPVVLSGAVPEDLAKAVAMALQLPSNNPTYQVEEANLVVLSGLTLEANREGEALEVLVVCGDFKVPEDLEITARQVLTLTVTAVRRTLVTYYSGADHAKLQCHVRLVGLPEEWAGLKELEASFKVGSAQD